MEQVQTLVVGIAAYRHVTPLPATVARDAGDLWRVLVDPARCGYDPGRSRLLVDEEATGARVRQALAELAACDPDTTVLIYFSGHGGRVAAGPHAGHYLLPVDAVADAPSDLAHSAISGAELQRALQAIPAGQVVVIFDCCHAAGVSPSAPEIEDCLDERLYAVLAAGGGRAVLAATRGDERAWAAPGARNSLFTTHLLAGLDGGALSADGCVRVFDLFEYVQPRVTAERRAQHPVFHADLTRNFPIACWETKRPPAQAFRYDAYVSFADQEADAHFVWHDLLPRLTAAGLRVAVSDDVEEPGVARVVNIERGVDQAKRFVVALSPAYLDDAYNEFQTVLAQTLGIEEGTARLLPVRIASLPPGRLPLRLRALTAIDLSRHDRLDERFNQLVRALRGPVPQHPGRPGREQVESAAQRPASRRGPTPGLEIVLTMGREGPDRWDEAFSELSGELSRMVGQDKVAPAKDPGAIILALGSAGAITAAVEVIRMWLGRARKRWVVLSYQAGGQERRIELRTSQLAEATTRELVLAMLTQTAPDTPS
jgi:hypothetical protein